MQLVDEIEAHRLACLARWVVEYHGGDGQRIAAWFERIQRERKPIAATPGLRERVREEWRKWKSEVTK